MADGQNIEVFFEDRRLPSRPPWRRMDEWEEALLRRHLEVDFDGAADLRALAEWPRVREMDECGCLEFETSENRDPHRIVTDGFGPDHPGGPPFQTMLSLTQDGHLLWLEFHRFGGEAAHRPSPESLRLFPFGKGWAS